MFALVADVRGYPEFLPWCTGAEVVSESGDEVVAGLEISQAALRGRFTTSNRLNRPDRMTMSLVEGPFSELEGEWTFEALGEQGSRIELDIRFKFTNPVKDMVLGAVFEQVCNRLVDAFVSRAGVVYG